MLKELKRRDLVSRLFSKPSGMFTLVILDWVCFAVHIYPERTSNGLIRPQVGPRYIRNSFPCSNVSSPQDIADSSLRPQLGVLLVQPDNMRGHGLRVRLSKSLVEATLQPKHRDALIRLHNRGHLKETVRFPYIAQTGRVTAAHYNPFRGLLDDLEVVRNQGSLVVCRGAQLFRRPEVVSGLGTLVLPC